MIKKLKNFLGLDIKADKYALVDDEIFGKVAKAKKPDKWVLSSNRAMSPSFEPNFKQTAVQLHSQKVPKGIEMKEEEIVGEIGYDKVLETKEMSTLKAEVKNSTL